MHIDINCDMGEGIGNDEAIMPFITSANIACGYHAGNKKTIRTAILLAKEFRVHIGAHPSFPDKENFGRTEMPCTPQELYNFALAQLHIFQTVADECKATVHHVKPHGALYNMVAKDPVLAKALSLAVKDFNGHLILYGLSNSCLITEAKRIGLRTMNEVFADRTYQDNGSLTPRSQAGAMIEEENKMLHQAIQMVNKKTVTTLSGKEITILPETICLHGDGPMAVAFARRLHESLKQPGTRG